MNNKYFDDNFQPLPSTPVVLLPRSEFDRYFDGDVSMLDTARIDIGNPAETANVAAFGGEMITLKEFYRRVVDGRVNKSDFAYTAVLADNGRDEYFSWISQPRIHNGRLLFIKLTDDDVWRD